MEERLVKDIIFISDNILVISPDFEIIPLIKGYLSAKHFVMENPTNINDIKLGVTYSCIIIFKITVDIIRDISRLCNKDTTLLFYYEGNLPLELTYHKSWFTDNVITTNYYICKLDKLKLVDKLPTIITCFFDIRTKEGNRETSGFKPISEYFRLCKDLMELEVPMVIFTEESLSHQITELRKQFEEITKINVIKVEELWGYALLERLTRNMEIYQISNINKKKDTPLYITLTNSKYDFIEKVLKDNPFNTERYIWIDFGICHVAKNFNSIRRWICNIGPKVRKLEITPYVKKIEPKIYFKTIYHNVAGGVISGDSNHLLEYCKLFKQYYVDILNDGWYQLDEAVMAMVDADYPVLSDNYYGDYPMIISGYDYYTGDDPKIYTLCFRNISFYLNSNIRDIPMKMLKYLEAYILHNNSKIKDYMYYYLITRYYVSDVKNIEEYLIPYLSKCLFDLDFVNKCKDNLKFYIDFS